MNRTLLCGSLFSAVLGFLVPAAMGVAIATPEINEDGTGFDSGISTSLITAGQSSVTGQTVSRAPDLFSATGLNDALASDAATSTLAFYNGLDTSPVTITYTLDKAYNISSVQSLAGWHDSYFGSQQFTVAFKDATTGLFGVPMGPFGVSAYTGTPPPGFPAVADDGFATRVTITDNASAVLAGNVNGVQFTFIDPYAAIGNINGTVIRELSVSGTPVPEPGALATGALLVGFFARRRRTA